MIELIPSELAPPLPTPLMDWMTRGLEQVSLALALPESNEATVVLTDDAEIRALNHEYRGLDESTDVLSFAMQEADDAGLTPDLLGDVVISIETALRWVESGRHRERLREADREVEHWDLGEELLFLAVHGVLHLVGHDHAEPEEEAAMRAEEARVFGAALHAVGTAPPLTSDEHAALRVALSESARD